MNTGEDINALRKIVDLTRVISVFILAIHFYLACYPAFEVWGLTAEITDRIVASIARTGFFSSVLRPKFFSLLLLFVSLVGTKGKKTEKQQAEFIAGCLILGLLFYFASAACFQLSLDFQRLAALYMLLTSAGYLLVLTGGSHFQGCILTIMDDKREEFSTKNPFLIDKVAMLLKFLCEDKLAEIEAELVLPH